MATALSEIITRAQANWPSGYHSSELSASTVLVRYANDAQREVCRSHNFDFMKQTVRKSTTDETQRYALPTAGDSGWTDVLSGTVLLFKKDVDLWLMNSQSYRVSLRKVYKSILEDKLVLAKVTGKGIPEYFTIEQGYIWLYKIPDHDYNSGSAWTMNLEFYGYLADLAAAGNNVLTNKHPLLLEYAITARGYAFGKDWNEYDRWIKKAQEIYSQMLDEDFELQGGGQEEGLFPSDADAIGGGEAGIGFLQDPHWYTE